MSHYVMIRRLRGPAFLLLVGVLALLNQADIIGWGRSWPFFLILAGVLQLAERAILASEGGFSPTPFPGTQYPGAPDPRAATGFGSYPGQPEAYIPPDHQPEPKKDFEGGEK